MTPQDAQRANDLIQALASQRNQHADDAAGLFADLLAAKREIHRLTVLLEQKNATEKPDSVTS